MSKRTINLIFKIAVALLLLGAVYYQIAYNERIEVLWQAFQNGLHPRQLPWLIFAVLLMPLNWGFETLKWHGLIHRFSALTFWQAYRSVLAGVAVSLFTPNRIGEYGGRVLLVESGNGWRAVAATLMGSVSQMVALLSGGVVGLALFASAYFQWPSYLLWSVTLTGAALSTGLLLIYWNVNLLALALMKLRPGRRCRIAGYNLAKPIKEILTLFRAYEKTELKHALFFAWARYFTYCLQYWLLLRFFGVEVTILEAWPGIATIFFLQTSVPLPPAISLLARGEIALLVWTAFGVNELSVLAATFGLFILNLCLPALLGGWFIVKTNVLKS
ncbi:MAG: lysylphosphatidylglycerol synthase transmembrane domain-containing protein [Saprospiraceae bacterium]|nr:lysylphosphatidylglycerol synthase transmembrane domain-containing protein [Saprospiraceae bacterium]MDZ4703400.1 lysylphosphatidylglycerol synthase transmembrane domain-containing protein [Saprospiraceae bacterium]